MLWLGHAMALRVIGQVFMPSLSDGCRAGVRGRGGSCALPPPTTTTADAGMCPDHCGSGLLSPPRIAVDRHVSVLIDDLQLPLGRGGRELPDRDRVEHGPFQGSDVD